MGTLDRPKLRPLAARRHDDRGRSFVAFDDPSGAFDGSVLVPMDLYRRVVRHFDGRSSLGEIASAVLRESGAPIALAELRRLAGRLDETLVLDGPAFSAVREDYARTPTRPAALAGRSYPSGAADLRDQLAAYFAHPAGAGLPGSPGANAGAGRLRAVLTPHIDFGRGGPTYTWAYRELVERSDAEVFVVLGVAHQPCEYRFALTRMDFETPLGTVPADAAYVDRLAELAGPHLFDDELAHRAEHSVEFQAVFLKYLMGDRPFTVVPVLVGSFHDLMAAGTEPIDAPDVRRFVEALKRAEAESGKRVAYVGGVDLCHVGPEFGDARPVDDATTAAVREFDAGLLGRASAGDPAGWFAAASAVDDRYRVCGLAAAYTLLHAVGPARGRLLRYEQAVDDRRQCLVSFASLALEAAGPERCS